MRRERRIGQSTSPIGARRRLRYSRSAAERKAAVSRTDRVTTPSWTMPTGIDRVSLSARSRPRVGLSPTSPHTAAGIRIDPPPSLAWAIGTTPAATNAAEPADEAPEEWAVDQGLRTGSAAGYSALAEN